MAKQVKTMKNVREEMIEVFSQLKARKVDLNIAAEMNRVFGKLISSVNSQCMYHKLRKEPPEIDFMNCN